MPEEVLFESERVMQTTDVAGYLRTVAEKLEGGEAITLSAGDEELTMSPPGQVEFEVKAEREGPANGRGELSVEFELEWDEDGGTGGEDLDIR
jgi:amphi-Trp domain-containing protein